MGKKTVGRNLMQFLQDFLSLGRIKGDACHHQKTVKTLFLRVTKNKGRGSMHQIFRELKANSPIFLAASFSVLVISLPAKADFFYDFENTLPDDTNVLSVGITIRADNEGIIEFSPSFMTEVENGNLVMSDTNPFGQIDPISGIGGAIRGIWLDTSETFSDVRVSSFVNPEDVAATTGAGIIARFNPLTFSGYSGFIDYDNPDTAPGRADMVIVKFAGGVVGNPIRLPGVLENDESYFIEFDAVANQFDFRVFDSPGGNLINSINFEDTGAGGLPVFLEGFSGLGTEANFPNIPLNAVFDQITSRSITVPEPSSVLGLGLLVGFSGWLGKSRN